MGRGERPHGGVRSRAPAVAASPSHGPVTHGLSPRAPEPQSPRSLNVLDEVLRAEHRIRPWIRETPCDSSPLGDPAGVSLHLKWDNQQHTGSFKARGAANRLLALADGSRAESVLAASTGNHGAAVSWAAGRLGIRARIVVPEDADPAKLAAIRSFGGETLFHGRDSAVAEAHARRLAELERLAYVSPYNDPQVIGGQGTVGVELARQLEQVDAVYVALGGGGLLAGVAGYLKAIQPGVRVIGCSPERSAVMIRSVREGRILDLPSEPTLSDGTAGGVEAGAITFELVRALADDYVTVSEEEIRRAMRLVFEAHRQVIEGAAGVALAGYLRQADHWRGRTVAVIICGGNVSPEVVRTVL